MALGLPLAFDVGLGDTLLCFGYELVYVLVPGWLAFRALSARPGSPLRQLTFGWALGYVLEILAFIGSAAIDQRWLLVVYPVAVGALTLPRLLRGRRSAGGGREPESAGRGAPAWAWAAAATAALTLVYAAVADYTVAPLPSTEHAVVYHPDQVFHLSIAAEAMNHWPMRDARVSGEAHAYHVFGHIHVAAMSQVTGVDLPVVYLRLYLIPLLILLTLQFTYAGRALTGNVWVGVAAAGLMLLVGELDVDPRQTLPNGAFYGYFFNSLYQSPSFVLGLALFLPAVLLLNDLLDPAKPPLRRREWLLLGLFLVGCAGAKVTIPPVLVGGLGLFALWRLLTSRRLRTLLPAALGAGAVLVVMVGFYLAQYRGHSSGTSLDLFGSTDSMLGVNLVKSWLEGAPGPLGSHALQDVVGTVVGLLALLAAPMIGLPFLLWARGRGLEPRHIWLLGIFATGLAGFLLIDPNGQFFLFYGVAAGGLLSAEGLVGVLEGKLDRPPVRVAGLALLWLAFISLLIVLPLELWDPSTTKANGALYFAWFAALALALLIVYLFARRTWLGGTAALVAAVVILGGLDTPLDNGPRWLKDERPLYEAFVGGMSGGLYEGLRWTRDHTGSDEVLAVNRGPADNPEAPASSRYFYYSAFSERRVFLEDWSFATKTYDVGARDPFPERVRLNQAVFERADPKAIRTLVRDYGVTHLLVDKHVPGVSPLLAQRGRLVFSNRAVAVYALRASGFRSRESTESPNGNVRSFRSHAASQRFGSSNAVFRRGEGSFRSVPPAPFRPGSRWVRRTAAAAPRRRVLKPVASSTSQPASVAAASSVWRR